MTPQRPVGGSSDDRFDELLRSAMHEEAETVVPSGDGLSKIQTQVAGRRSRQRWLRPMLALGSAVAVMAVGVGVYAVTNNDGTAKVDVGTTDSPTPAPSTPTPSTTDVPVPGGDFPESAIFPFITAEEAQSWQASYEDGHQPWVADPRGVAEAWVQNYLQVPAIDEFISKESDGETADVTLGRTMTAEMKRLVPVTVVHLVKYGDAWLVTGADDPAAAPYTLKLTAPASGEEVSSPVTVSGPGFGVDEAAEIQVRDATTPTELGTGHASWGDQPEWSTTVDFDTPPHSVGVVVAREDSMADGGPQRLVAVQVRFGETAPAASSAPQYFYGVKNGRVTKFSARTGAAIEYLTAEEPGGGASSPQLVNGKIYYLRGGGTCVNSIAAVSTDGTGAEESVASPDEGYVIQSFVTDGTQFTIYEVACFPDMQPQAKLITRAPSGAPGPIRFTSIPPGIEGDLTYAPGSTKMLDAFVSTGTQGYLAKYDLYNDNTATPERNACTGYDINRGIPVGATSSAGSLWFAIDAGDVIEVIRCTKGTPTVVTTVPSSRGPSDLAVSADSSAVLVSDNAGRVWRWEDGSAQRLSDLSVPLDHLTW
jgi:hypothetical protein